MEASVIVVANSIESKEEESKKNENENKNDESVSAAVIESGDCNNTADIITAADAASSSESSSQKKNQKKNSNRILVSHTKKPFVFYLSLAKRYIKQYNDIELSGLGMAIPTVVTIAEALKRDGLASHQEVKLSTVNSKEVHKGHFVPKAKIQIVLRKGKKLDKARVATTAPTSSTD